MEMIRNFMQEEDGVTAIEYGLIAALIAIIIIAAVQGTGTNVKAVFSTICTKLSGVTGLTGGTTTCS